MATRPPSGRGPHRPNSKPEPRTIPLPPQSVRAFRETAGSGAHPHYDLAKFVAWYEGFPSSPPRELRGAVSHKKHAFDAARRRLGAEERIELASAVHARRSAWLAPLELDGRARRLILEARSNVVVHLVSPGPLELGLALHHVYGFPILPASGLKGLCRAEHTGEFGNSESYGTQESVARVALLDGLPLSVKVEPDVMTPHYGDWYQKESAPHDGMNPNPIAFLSVGAGSRFEIALVAREVEGAGAELDAIEADLHAALAERGLGAKTAAGYGVFRVARADPAAPAVVGSGLTVAAPSPRRDPVQAKLDEVRALNSERIAGQVGPYVEWCLSLPDPSRQKEAASALLAIVAEKMGGKFVKERVKTKDAWKKLKQLGGEGE